jgi:5-methylcytosine-specific restriction protein A
MNAKWPYNTSRWQKLRRAKLSLNPLCYSCDLRGRAVVATAVDHVTPIKAGGHPFPGFDELMSLCHSCHSLKTQAVDRQDRWGNGRRFAGFDLDGNPIDPGDDWHREGGVKDRKGPSPEPASSSSLDLFSWKAV